MTLYKRWITRERGQKWALWVSFLAFLLLTIGWLGAIVSSTVASIAE